MLSMMMLGFSQLLASTFYVFITIFSYIFRCSVLQISSDFSSLDTVHKWLWKNRFQYGLAKLTNQQLLPVGLIFGFYKRRPFIAYTSSQESGGKGRGGDSQVQGGVVYLVIWNKPKWLDINDFDKNGCKKEIPLNAKISQSSFSTIPFIQSRDAWVGSSLCITKRRVIKSAKKSQLDVIDFILRMTKERERKLKPKGCVVLIHGPRGSGKSSIGKVLSIKLKATFCPFFTPIEAGEWFDSIYSIAKPTDKKPLVVMIEEVDTMIQAILDGKVANKNKHMKVLCSNKASWNHWFDNLSEYYPHVYIIMTMNSSLDQINSLDSSMIREGRVDAYVSFGYPKGDSHDEEEMKANHLVVIEEELVDQQFNLFD